MGTLLAELHQDHINVARLLDEIERQVDGLKAGGTLSLTRLGDIMRYMTEYPDLVHHPREDVIFDRLIELDRSAVSAVESIRLEHGELAAASLNIVDRLRTAEPGQAGCDTVAGALHQYVGMLRAHMNKEESQLFPRARAVLRDPDWLCIEARLRSKPDPLFGGRVQETYRALYSFISRTQ